MPSKKRIEKKSDKPLTRSEMAFALEALAHRFEPGDSAKKGAGGAQPLGMGPGPMAAAPGFCSDAGRNALKASQRTGGGPPAAPWRVTRLHVVRRTLAMLRCETNRDFSGDNPATPLPDPPLGAAARGNLKGAVNTQWFDDVRCKVQSAALQAAGTLAELYETIYLAVHQANRA